MAGSSWGTREELLHPRDRKGRWRKKWGLSAAKLKKIWGILDAFSEHMFGSDKEASDYIKGTGRGLRGDKKGVGAHRTSPRAVRDLLQDYDGIESRMRSGKTTPQDRVTIAGTKAAMEPSDRDLALSRVVPAEAFGLTPQTLQGDGTVDVDGAENEGIKEFTGKLIADRAFGTATIGTPIQSTGQNVRMVIAAPKGTRMVHPPDTPEGDRQLILDADQPLQVTKVDWDEGTRSWNMYAIAVPHSDKETPTPIGGPDAPPARQAVPDGNLPEPQQAVPGGPPVRDGEPVVSEGVGGAPDRQAPIGGPAPVPAPGSQETPLPWANFREELARRPDLTQADEKLASSDYRMAILELQQGKDPRVIRTRMKKSIADTDELLDKVKTKLATETGTDVAKELRVRQELRNEEIQNDQRRALDKFLDAEVKKLFPEEEREESRLRRETKAQEAEQRAVGRATRAAEKKAVAAAKKKAAAPPAPKAPAAPKRKTIAQLKNEADAAGVKIPPSVKKRDDIEAFLEGAGRGEEVLPAKSIPGKKVGAPVAKKAAKKALPTPEGGPSASELTDAQKEAVLRRDAANSRNPGYPRNEEEIRVRDLAREIRGEPPIAAPAKAAPAKKVAKKAVPEAGEGPVNLIRLGRENNIDPGAEGVGKDLDDAQRRLRAGDDPGDVANLLRDRAEQRTERLDEIPEEDVEGDEAESLRYERTILRQYADALDKVKRPVAKKAAKKVAKKAVPETPEARRARILEEARERARATGAIQRFGEERAQREEAGRRPAAKKAEPSPIQRFGEERARREEARRPPTKKEAAKAAPSPIQRFGEERAAREAGRVRAPAAAPAAKKAAPAKKAAKKATKKAAPEKAAPSPIQRFGEERAQREEARRRPPTKREPEKAAPSPIQRFGEERARREREERRARVPEAEAPPAKKVAKKARAKKAGPEKAAPSPIQRFGEERARQEEVRRARAERLLAPEAAPERRPLTDRERDIAAESLVEMRRESTLSPRENDRVSDTLVKVRTGGELTDAEADLTSTALARRLREGRLGTRDQDVVTEAIEKVTPGKKVARKAAKKVVPEKVVKKAAPAKAAKVAKKAAPEKVAAPAKKVAEAPAVRPIEAMPRETVPTRERRQGILKQLKEADTFEEADEAAKKLRALDIDRSLAERNLSRGGLIRERRDRLIDAVAPKRAARQGPSEDAVAAAKVLESMDPELRQSFLDDLTPEERQDIDMALEGMKAAKAPRKKAVKKAAKKAAPEQPRLTPREAMQRFGEERARREESTQARAARLLKEAPEAAPEAPPAKKVAKKAAKAAAPRARRPLTSGGQFKEGDRVVWQPPGEAPLIGTVHIVPSKKGERTFTDIEWDGGRRQRVNKTGIAVRNMRWATSEDEAGPARTLAPAPKKVAPAKKVAKRAAPEAVTPTKAMQRFGEEGAGREEARRARAAKLLGQTLEAEAPPTPPAKKAAKKAAPSKFLSPLADGTPRKSATNVEVGDEIAITGPQRGWGVPSKVTKVERTSDGVKITREDGTSRNVSNNAVFRIGPRATPAKKAAGKVKIPLTQDEAKALDNATPESLRDAAKSLGLPEPKGDDKDEVLDDLIKSVARQELERRGVGAPTPAKKAVTPVASPGTAAGKITAGRLTPGTRILVRQRDDGVWEPTNRKTGSKVITFEGLDPAPGRTRTRLIVRGRDDDGNEIRVENTDFRGQRGVPAHQTFLLEPPPRAAKAVKKAAAPKKASVEDRVAANLVDRLTPEARKGVFDEMTPEDRAEVEDAIKRVEAEKLDSAALMKRLDDFDNPPSLEEAHELIKDLKPAELRAMARALNVPRVSRLNKQQLRDEIVHATSGRRLDSIATRGFKERTPFEAPITPGGKERGPAGQEKLADALLPAADKPKATKSTPPARQDARGIVDALKNSPSREDAHRIIEKKKVAELREIAEAANIPVPSSVRTKADLQRHIVNFTTGARIDSEALRSLGKGMMSGGTPTPGSRRALGGEEVQPYRLNDEVRRLLQGDKTAKVTARKLTPGTRILVKNGRAATERGDATPITVDRTVKSKVQSPTGSWQEDRYEIVGRDDAGNEVRIPGNSPGQSFLAEAETSPTKRAVKKAAPPAAAPDLPAASKAPAKKATAPPAKAAKKVAPAATPGTTGNAQVDKFHEDQKLTPREKEIDTRIREAYGRLRGNEDLPEGAMSNAGVSVHRAMRRGDYVALADLREELKDLPRNEVDDALRKMSISDSSAFTTEITYGWAKLPRDDEAALRLGGSNDHFLKIDPPGRVSGAPAKKAVKKAAAPAADGLDDMSLHQLQNLATEFGVPDPRKKTAATLIRALRREGAVNPATRQLPDQPSPETSKKGLPEGEPTLPQETPITDADPPTPGGTQEDVPLVSDPDGDNSVMHGDSASMNLAQAYAAKGRNGTANKIMELRRYISTGRGEGADDLDGPQRMVDELKRLRDVETDVNLKKRLDHVIEQLDIPKEPIPDLPEGTPPALRQLVEDLNRIPVARAPAGHRLEGVTVEDASAVERVARILREVDGSKGQISFGDVERRISDVLRTHHESIDGAYRMWGLDQRAESDNDMRKALQNWVRGLRQPSGEPQAPSAKKVARKVTRGEPTEAEVAKARKDFEVLTRGGMREEPSANDISEALRESTNRALIQERVDARANEIDTPGARQVADQYRRGFIADDEVDRELDLEAAKKATPAKKAAKKVTAPAKTVPAKKAAPRKATGPEKVPGLGEDVETKQDAELAIGKLNIAGLRDLADRLGIPYTDATGKDALLDLIFDWLDEPGRFSAILRYNRLIDTMRNDRIATLMARDLEFAGR